MAARLTNLKTLHLIGFVLVAAMFGATGKAGPLDAWTWRYPFPPPTVWKFAFGNGQFVGVGYSGSIVSSTDGLRWIVRQSGTHKDLNGIAFGNGQFVAVGAAILISTDGVNWVERPTGTQAQLYDIAYGDGQFVAVGDLGVLLSGCGTRK